MKGWKQANQWRRYNQVGVQSRPFLIHTLVHNHHRPRQQRHDLNLYTQLEEQTREECDSTPSGTDLNGSHFPFFWFLLLRLLPPQISRWTFHLSNIPPSSPPLNSVAIPTLWMIGISGHMVSLAWNGQRQRTDDKRINWRRGNGNFTGKKKKKKKMWFSNNKCHC